MVGGMGSWQEYVRSQFKGEGGVEQAYPISWYQNSLDLLPSSLFSRLKMTIHCHVFYAR